MSSRIILSETPIVDNPPRYTREQRQAGGRIRGEQRRLEARPRHAEIRRLHAEGCSQAEIARQIHYHPSTVSRVLRGIIRTCLTAAETAAKIIAYPLESIRRQGVLRKLSYAQGSKSKSVAFGRKRTLKKAWNFYKGKWAGYFRQKFSQLDPAQAEGVDFRAWHMGIELGIPVDQCCPVCGIQPMQREAGDGY